MILRTLRVLEAMLLVAASAAPLAAQVPVQVGFLMDATAARVRGVTMGLTTGTIIGGRGDAMIGPVRLSLGYHEGRLHDGMTQPLLVEGGAAADLQLLPWISVGLGPQARAYKLDSMTVRRVWLAGRIGVAVPLIGNTVRTDLQLWRSLVTSATGADLDHVAGGEVGIAYWAPTRWWIRLATTFDDVSFAGAPGHERLNGLTLSAGFGR